MSAVNEAFEPDEHSQSKNKSSGNLSQHPQKLDYSTVPNRPQFQAAFSASLSGFIVGTWLGWISPVQPQLQNLDGRGDPSSIWFVELSDEEISWVGSLFNLGAFFGCMAGGMLMDRFGRKTTMLMTAVPNIVAWLIAALSVDTSMLYIARLLGGMAGGICTVAAPSYIGEITTANKRGSLGSVFQLSLCIGIVVSSLLGLGLNWRLISGILEVFPLISLTAVAFIPESPYYLVKKERRAEALLALRWLRGDAFDVDSELAEMEASYQIEKATVSGWSDVIQPWALKPILTSIGLMVFTQLCGVNAAQFNAVDIFRTSGIAISGVICAVILNSSQFLTTLAATFVIERSGRRVLFLASQLTCGVSMFVLGAYFYIKQTDEETAATITWLPLVSLIVFNSGFAFGSGPIPWIMNVELVPSKVKGFGVSLAALINWFLAFVVSKTFVNIETGLTKAGTFWLFGCFGVLGVLFSIFLLPETKGKTPEEIQDFFKTKRPDRHRNSVDPLDC